MPPLAQIPPAADLVLAHPVLEHSGLGFPPLLMASITAWLVFLVAFALPDPVDRPAQVSSEPGEPPPPASWSGGLSGSQLTGRAIGVVLLLVAVIAGRVGADDQLENLAPALIVGSAWPLLVLTSVLLGPVWRWLDPWDSLARLLERSASPSDGSVDAAVDAPRRRSRRRSRRCPR